MQTRDNPVGRNAYYPVRQADQTAWLTNSVIKLPGQATALGLAAAQVTAAGADCGWSAWLNLCEIQEDRGDGKGFALLTIDTTPNYTDTTPLPAGQSAVWKYRAIFHQGDARVGQWSETASIAVAG